MTTLSERTQEILSAMEGPDRGKQSRLALIAGCTRGLVNQWLAGLNDSMDYKYAKNIQDGLGFSVEWILNDRGPAKLAGSKKEMPISSGPSAAEELENISKMILAYKDGTLADRKLLANTAEAIIQRIGSLNNRSADQR